MNEKTRKIVGTGILTAIVIVLQSLALGIKFGTFSISLVLVPIVVGAALYGWRCGAWLGLVFGVVVLMTDAGAFLAINVPGTIVTCILKGVLAGTCAGLIYKAFEKKNKLLAVLSAAIVCPIVNTGIFLLGSVIFFLDTLREWGAGAGYENVGVYLIVGFVGINFVIEMCVNIFLSSAIMKILNVIKKPSKA